MQFEAGYGAGAASSCAAPSEMKRCPTLVIRVEEVEQADDRVGGGAEALGAGGVGEHLVAEPHLEGIGEGFAQDDAFELVFLEEASRAEALVGEAIQECRGPVLAAQDDPAGPILPGEQAGHLEDADNLRAVRAGFDHRAHRLGIFDEQGAELA